MSRRMLRGDAVLPSSVAGSVRMMQTDGAFPLYLYKRDTADLYGVQYGQQLDYDLTYDEAARKLGEASMHLLAYDGRLDQ